jgi:Mn-containing catalase
MFYHVKELQYNARVSKPDPHFARMLLEQFGGCNGELKAAMQYFVQAFGCKNPYPDKYDMLMDIATEEFSHLEIVGATIQMLLTGVNGELKLASETDELSTVLNGKTAKENYIHEAMVNPHFFAITGGGPAITDSNGNPWQASYVSAMGDLTVDLRSNMAAESTAKLTYERLMQFTDDVYVKDTLRFLMTREVAHYQMFEAALSTIQPNFPPGILQSDPKHSNTYFNMSKGDDYKGPWNEGETTQMGETWQFINDPHKHVIETNGLVNRKPEGTDRNDKTVAEHNDALAKERSAEVNESTPAGNIKWSEYHNPKK